MSSDYHQRRSTNGPLLRFLFPFIIGCILVSQLNRYSVGGPTTIGMAYLTLALLALLSIDAFIFQHRGAVNPVRVYLVIALALLLLGWCIYALSFLSPLLLFGILALLGILVAALTKILKPNLPQQREDAGLCPQCGYDLRATTDRCPECNTPIPESLKRRRRAAQRIAQNGAAAAQPELNQSSGEAKQGPSESD